MNNKEKDLINKLIEKFVNGEITETKLREQLEDIIKNCLMEG